MPQRLFALRLAYSLLGGLTLANCVVSEADDDVPVDENHCENGIQDANESGVDCGGDCSNCLGEGCITDLWCESENCVTDFNDYNEDDPAICIPAGCDWDRDVDPFVVRCSNGSTWEPQGDGGSSACADVEAELAATWITPEDAEVDPNGFYATLTLSMNPHEGEAAQYASGASQFTPIENWFVQGSDCDELWLDYGGGFGSDYSEIRELSSTTLELQATDGSYYGQVTRYRREGAPEPEAPGTCRTPCSSNVDCDAGQACLETETGFMCLAMECSTCFAQNQACFASWSCEFLECASPSNTCGNSCAMGEPCDPGEQCVDTGAGLNCLPPACAECIAGGQLCDYDGTYCVFIECL